MENIFETERLLARELRDEDYPALAAIMQDEQAMYAYVRPFTDEETWEWLYKQYERYRRDGIGLWAIVLRESGEMIGQCGLTWQEANGERLLEIGYLFQRKHWHRGYAIEAARACRRRAFEVLRAPRVYSIIRNDNVASMNVAIRNGMLVCGAMVKHYRGEDLPHFLFCAENPENT